MGQNGPISDPKLCHLNLYQEPSIIFVSYFALKETLKIYNRWCGSCFRKLPFWGKMKQIRFYIALF